MRGAYATGRRKRAISKVRLLNGKGKVTVNGRELKDYFPFALQRQILLEPLEKLQLSGRYDISISTRGGGLEGQLIASRLGISRALVKESLVYREELKKVGFLTRDPRKKERKKYGQPGARKKFQFSKR